MNSVPFASLRGVTRLVAVLSILCVGCMLQPLPDPPGALEKVAVEDTTEAVPAAGLPPVEPWIPI